MNKDHKRDFIIFLSALLVIGATFAGGIRYLRITGKENSSPALTALADVTTAVPTEVATATTTPTATTPTTPTGVGTGTTGVGTGSGEATTTTVVAAPTTPTPAATTTTTAAPTAATPAPAPKPKPPTKPTPAKPGAPALTLPYSIGTFDKGFGASDGWSNWWGGTAEANGVLTIGATDADTTESGGGILLASSGAWTNYTFTATLDWLKGQSFDLVGRYADDKNYVECDFSEPEIGTLYISVQQQQNGKTLDLADGTLINYNQLGGTGIHAALQVSGTQVTCAFNNQTVSTLFANTSLVGAPTHGEIGITAWDPTDGNSAVAVHNVSVTNEIYNLGQNVESN